MNPKEYELMSCYQRELLAEIGKLRQAVEELVKAVEKAVEL